MNALAFILAGAVLMQAPTANANPPQNMTAEQQREWLNRSRGVPPTKYPTGVVLSQLPSRPTVQTHGPTANAFVSAAIAAPQSDPSLPDIADQPWMLLVGPEDATGQAIQQIPEDILSKVRVVEKEATPEVIRRWRLKSAYGVQCRLSYPDGSVEYEGLFELERVLEALRRMLGLPEPDDDDDWFPIPIRPRVEFNMPWLWIGIAFALGTFFGRPVARFIILIFEGAWREMRSPSSRPPASPPN